MAITDSGEPKTIVLHLVSHASGELVEMITRNSVAQLDGVSVDRTLWKMVRSLAQLPEILASIGEKPGLVFHSIMDVEIRSALHGGCRQLHVPCVFVLEPFIAALAEHSGAETHYRSTIRDDIFEEYYRRVEAMKYAIAHDDGLDAEDLEDADVILVGVSRATKTPTCMYLASRGIKAANVPVVPGVDLPDGVLNAKAPLVVGLTVDPQRLMRVRAARLQSLAEHRQTEYSDIERITEEVREARRQCGRRGWPMIDASHRSIEHNASMIIDLLEKRRAATAAAKDPDAPGDGSAEPAVTRARFERLALARHLMHCPASEPPDFRDVQPSEAIEALQNQVESGINE